MDQQQRVQPQSDRPSGGQPRNPWDILFRIAKHTWPVAVIWIAGFFIQNWIIRNTSLINVPRISLYYEFVLLIEAGLLFALFERLLPKDWWK